MRQSEITIALVIQWLKKHLESRGIVGIADFTISYCSDYLFDFRYGTSTIGWVDELKTDSSNAGHSSRYQPSKARPLRMLLNRLSFPNDSVFVDIGSGKGRALLLAASFGFKKARGIEFCEDLCEAARSNIVAYRASSGCQAEFEVIECDIVEYNIRNDENVFYLYNPFDEVVLPLFLENLKKSIDDNDRDIWLIYHIAEHAEVIHKSGIFSLSTNYNLGGVEFIVFRRVQDTL